MTKDPSIKEMIMRLDLNANGWCAVDYWESDLCAIGIARSDDYSRLVYISTYNRGSDMYDYECEAQSEEDENDYSVVESGLNVDFDTLQQVIKRYLK